MQTCETCLTIVSNIKTDKKLYCELCLLDQVFKEANEKFKNSRANTSSPRSH